MSLGRSLPLLGMLGRPSALDGRIAGAASESSPLGCKAALPSKPSDCFSVLFAACRVVIVSR